MSALTLALATTLLGALALVAQLWSQARDWQHRARIAQRERDAARVERDAVLRALAAARREGGQR